MHVDDLFDYLDKSHIGCHIDNVYVNNVVADIDDTEVIWIALLRHADKLVLPEDRTK